MEVVDDTIEMSSSLPSVTLPQHNDSSASLRDKELEVEVVARKMFYGGCALLPWLWLVNIIYFRRLYFADDCPPGVRKCKP